MKQIDVGSETEIRIENGITTGIPNTLWGDIQDEGIHFILRGRSCGQELELSMCNDFRGDRFIISTLIHSLIEKHPAAAFARSGGIPRLSMAVMPSEGPRVRGLLRRQKVSPSGGTGRVMGSAVGGL
ncbi:hypothetical protein EVAR_74533_1 [Eumeta japonica]|uniref:Uncharacterized protein n=1 Tax=Eumeta variegata TaxID=151549 RepID=A0A4C1TBR2_EUMVA|nr:hypothetical protein EVAR_74533_1 [Eumeta japonica]